MPPKNGVSIKHREESVHVTRWQSDGDDDKGTRESTDYKPSGGGWVRDESSTHTTDQNYGRGDSRRHG